MSQLFPGSSSPPSCSWLVCDASSSRGHAWPRRWNSDQGACCLYFCILVLTLILFPTVGLYSSTRIKEVILGQKERDCVYFNWCRNISCPIISHYWSQRGKIVIVLMAYCDIMKEIIKSHDSQRKWHSFTRWTVAAYNQNSEIRFFSTLEWNYGSESHLFLVSSYNFKDSSQQFNI